jgi:hypothetical protein
MALYTLPNLADFSRRFVIHPAQQCPTSYSQAHSVNPNISTLKANSKLLEPLLNLC